MIKIIADTTSCLSLAEAQALGIYYVPQIVIIGDESYKDDTEIDAKTFLQRQRTSPVLPKTAAPPPAFYTPIYQELAEQGHTMIVLCPSAELSGTLRGATVAAQDFPGADIRIVDTRLVAGGLGAVVKQAREWAEAGMDADTIVEKVQEMASRHRIYFMVDTLEFLHKGGRIGGAKALVGSILQVKPILTMRDGRIDSFESQRTHKRALARLKEIVLADCPRDQDAHLSIMHAEAEDLARQIAEELGGTLGIPSASIPIYDLTAAILTYSGPGAIAISYFVKPGQ